MSSCLNVALQVVLGRQLDVANVASVRLDSEMGPIHMILQVLLLTKGLLASRACIRSLLQICIRLRTDSSLTRDRSRKEKEYEGRMYEVRSKPVTLSAMEIQ